MTIGKDEVLAVEVDDVDNSQIILRPLQQQCNHLNKANEERPSPLNRGVFLLLTQFI